jgi:predicted amidohydrolase YtcJ
VLKGGAALAGGLALGPASLARAGFGGGPADTVFAGGTIRTLDPAQPLAEAVAIAGGRIAYVGSSGGVAAHVGAGTTTVDLGGGTMLPGIHDGHVHPLSGGRSLTDPSSTTGSFSFPSSSRRWRS